jgi:hypothetical protein
MLRHHAVDALSTPYGTGRAHVLFLTLGPWQRHTVWSQLNSSEASLRSHDSRFSRATQPPVLAKNDWSPTKQTEGASSRRSCGMPGQDCREEATRRHERSVSDPAPAPKAPTASAGLAAIHHDPYARTCASWNETCAEPDGATGKTPRTRPARGRDGSPAPRHTPTSAPPAAAQAPVEHRTAGAAGCVSCLGVGAEQHPAPAMAGRRNETPAPPTTASTGRHGRYARGRSPRGRGAGRKW